MTQEEALAQKIEQILKAHLGDDSVGPSRLFNDHYRNLISHRKSLIRELCGLYGSVNTTEEIGNIDISNMDVQDDISKKLESAFDLERQVIAFDSRQRSIVITCMEYAYKLGVVRESLREVNLEEIRKAYFDGAIFRDDIGYIPNEENWKLYVIQNNLTPKEHSEGETGWISVNDKNKRPPVNHFVLCATTENRIVRTWIDNGTKEFDIMEISYDSGERYTHWREIPSLPTKK